MQRAKPSVLNRNVGNTSDTRKVEHLLAAFEKAKVPATYFALDISEDSLKRSVSYLAKRHSKPEANVTCAGIWGTFEDGQAFVDRWVPEPRLFLSLGSVLCNDDWAPAVNRLQEWGAVMRPSDLLLVGMDAHLAQDYEHKIEQAYHLRKDLLRDFFLNGFRHANDLLGQPLFQEEDWEFCCALERSPTTRHRIFLRAKNDIRCDMLDRVIKTGEEFDWFDSHKYGELSVRRMCYEAGLIVSDVWKDGSEFRKFHGANFANALSSLVAGVLMCLFARPILDQTSRRKVSRR